MPINKKSDLAKAIASREADLVKRIEKTQSLINGKKGITPSDKLYDRLFSQSKSLVNAENEVLDKRFERRSKSGKSGASLTNSKDNASAFDILGRNRDRAFLNSKRGPFDPLRSTPFMGIDKSRIKRLIAKKKSKGLDLPDIVDDLISDKNDKRLKRLQKGLKDGFVFDKESMDRMSRQSKIDFPEGGDSANIPRQPKGLSSFLKKLGVVNTLMQMSDLIQGKNVDDILVDNIPILNQADAIGVGGVDEERRRGIESGNIDSLADLRRFLDGR